MAQELKHRKGWVAVKELELRRANTKGWAVVGRTSIEQEETAEVIVPDAQPDIWQVWDASTCLLLQRTADKGTQGHAGHLQRVLEGKKNALFRPLVDRKVGDVLPLEKDLSRGDDIRRVSGDSIAESGFSGTVWAH